MSCYVPIIAPFKHLSKSTQVLWNPLYSSFKPFLIILRSSEVLLNLQHLGVYSGVYAVRSKGDTPNEAKRSTGRDR